MDPEADELVLVVLLHHLRRDEQHAPDHAGKVTQVEDVVGLGGRRQEVGYGLLVDAKRGLNHDLYRQMTKSYK